MRWLWLCVLLGAAWGQKVSLTFSYDPPSALTQPIESVSVRGSFNGWTELPMQKNSEGVWQVTLELDPGVVQYKYFINGQWPADMCNDATYGTPQIDAELQTCSDDGHGGQNAVRDLQWQEKPSDQPTVEHDPNQARFVSEVAGQLSVRLQAAPAFILSGVLEVDTSSYPLALQLAYPGAEIWRARLPASISGTYRIKLQTQDGEKVLEHTLPTKRFKALDWVANRTGYQIFPDRFWNGDPANDRLALNTDQSRFDRTWKGPKPYVSKWSDPPGLMHCCQQYFGGDLAGVIKRLPHLKSLGVNLIYFNPIFDSGSAHGYDTHDYLKLSPKFGSQAVLDELIKKAHSEGIKLIFDFVPNHTGLGHQAFQDVVKNGSKSKYWNWYTIKRWPFTPGDGSAYVGWAGVSSLPRLNTDNPQVQSYMIEATQYWLKKGFDGVRVDAVNEISVDFLRKWHKAIKATKPDVYLIGELWDSSPSYLQGDLFDSLMNYTLGRGGSPPAVGGALGFAVAAVPSGKRILGDLARVYATYPEAVGAMGFNLIGSHDTPRVLTDLGGGGLKDKPSVGSLARLKLASAVLYALPGVSVVFQGEECGFTGERGQWPINELYRYPIQWSGCSPDMLAHYRLLGKLRQNPVLSGSFSTYQAEGFTMAFYRNEGNFLALFNSGPSTAMALPEGQWRDLVENKLYTKEATMLPMGWRYLKRESK
jgi:cyclomaltodextrinase / maltogenic alpha-amylase / neopullulanase